MHGLIEWRDLLAIPFKLGSDDPAQGGIDCWGQARIVCGRAGLMLPDIGLARPSSEASAAALAPLVRIDAATRIGDLLFSDPTKLGYPSHVATVVSSRVAISTCERHGPYAWPIHKMPCGLGCWRVAS